MSTNDLATRILQVITAANYTPLKAKALFSRLKLGGEAYAAFRKTLKRLVQTGQVVIGRGHTIRPAEPFATVVGIYRRVPTGHGYVRPHAVDGTPQAADIFIRADRALDAATGDEVLVRVLRPASKTRDASGEIVQVLERATRTFVGTYFEREGQGFVRVDGNVFTHSVSVGDAGAKGAKAGDKVVVEMLRFPTPEERGEGVITEVLGPLHQPGVDTLTVIRAFGLPDTFPAEVLAEARQVASQFEDMPLQGREDFTHELVVTIDPPDAKDFDDAVSVSVDPKSRHWILSVHIADVGAFVKAGGALDQEARRRGTSVYLPQKVLPMFPEVLSNGLASLQEGKVRWVKTVRLEYTPHLQKGSVTFHNAVIRNRRRFTYDQVQAVLDELERREQAGWPPARVIAEPVGQVEVELVALIRRMRDLARLLRKKRLRRGALELEMPETVLEYDDQGRICGAHYATHTFSHRIIEEFMLAANEAVAEHLTAHGVLFLRRVHPPPQEDKLAAFAQFAALLGYPLRRPQDRFELQRVLQETADKPERAALHYALLRSLKQAVYSPIAEEHYALALRHYCHFTSPIRRYPDLQVHRQLDRLLRRKKPVAQKDELIALGDHCSKMERRAELAERELVKLKVLTYLSERIGERFDAVITGVADYGFYAQAEKFPAEGLVHISSLVDDYYWYDADSYTLQGQRTGRRFRLGDRVRVEVARVDLVRRLLDFRLAGDLDESPRKASHRKWPRLGRSPRHFRRGDDEQD
ncbi:ribonuclease R [Thermogemmata fonticola]|uniref:Ribonuclease R n=1 Tax=Thermogemmata fonticola TaxID=2755323 RepID=A0A7V9ABW7_9BACT|nr:ribonuclease R [Thermogemmata fonticola]MBA2226503.1 ribonuclease R [Thermogemmata fonticola]